MKGIKVLVLVVTFFFINHLQAQELINAIKAGNQAKAIELINKGHDVNETDAQGQTPLHHAVQKDLIKIAELLLVRGAGYISAIVLAYDLKKENFITLLKFGELTIVLAKEKYPKIEAETPESVQKEIEKLENDEIQFVQEYDQKMKEIENKIEKARNQQNYTESIKLIQKMGSFEQEKLEKELDLLKKIGELKLKKIKLEKVETKLSKEQALTNLKGLIQYPLHEAAKHGFALITKILIEHVPLEINKKDFEVNTPLHYAMMGNHVEIAKKLIKAGGWKSLSTVNNDNKNPYNLANQEMKKKFLKVVLAINKVGWSSLSDTEKAEEINKLLEPTVEERLNSLIEDLKKTPADVVALKQKYKLHYPLHSAAKWGFTNIIDELINLKIFDINKQTEKSKDTPLHFAAIYSKHEIIKILLEAGANPTIQNANNQIPLQLSKKGSDAEKYLSQAKAPPSELQKLQNVLITLKQKLVELVKKLSVLK